MESDGGNKYLSDDAPAMPASLFSSLTENQPNQLLLFEGAGEGKGPLVLTLHKGGQKIGEYPLLYLHRSDVKKMYERAKVTSTSDPIASPSGTAYPANDPPEPTMGWVRDPNGNPPDYSPASWQETIARSPLTRWPIQQLGQFFDDFTLELDL